MSEPRTRTVGAAVRAAAHGDEPKTLRGLDAVALLLAGIAFRDLLVLRLDSVEVRYGRVDWFFDASETAPIVVILIAVWMLRMRWQRFGGLDSAPRQPIATSVLLSAGFASFFWAARTGASDLLLPSLALSLLGVAWGLAGSRGIRSALLPAAFLGFAMPLPAPLLNHLLWALQIWTAEFTGALLDAIGVAVLVSGDQILTADRTFAVIESCSGLRSILTLTMLAVLMSHLFRRRCIHALLLIVAAPPTAFAINAIRAMALVLNPHSDVTAVHTLQGVVMLLAGVAALYALDGVLARLLPAIANEPTERTAPRAAAAVVRPASPVRHRGLALLMASYAAMSLWLPAWSLEPRPLRAPSSEIPAQIGDWTGVDLRTDWMFLGQTAYAALIHRRYTRGETEIDLFVGVPPQLRSRSAFSPKSAFPGSGWIIEQRGEASLADYPVGTSVMRKGPRRVLILHGVLGEYNFFSETLRALLGLDASPLRRSVPPVVIRLTIPFSGGAVDRKYQETELADFAHRIEAGIGNLLTPRGVNR